MQIAYKPARRIYGKTKGKIQNQSKVPPIDFHAKTGLAVEYSMSGNMAQASTQEYSITDIPPIDFQSDGSGISAYSIYGNMVQKSPNLSPSISTWNNGYLNFAGEVVAPDATKREMYSNQIAVKPSTNYVFSCENGFPSSEPSTAWKTASLYKADGTYITRLTATTDSDPFAITTTSETGFIVIMLRTFGENVNIMLNEGATALPYIPYDATPTPDAPIMPEETGEKTGNLCNATSNSTTAYFRVFCDKQELLSVLEIDKTLSLTLTTDVSLLSNSIYLVTENPSYQRIVGIIFGTGTVSATFTLSDDDVTAIQSAQTFRFQVYKSGADFSHSTNAMLNSGSTVIPYEPYNKYKIPVTNAGTTTNIYALEPLRKIGDYADVAESTNIITRYMKCVDLGDLTWTSSSLVRYTADLGDGVVVPNTDQSYGLCSHLTVTSANTVANNTPYTISTSLNSGGPTRSAAYVYIPEFSGKNVDEFKVAVKGIKLWYPLVTPTTETITSPTISTVSGTNTLSIGTTLQPSNVSLTTSSSVYPLNPIIPEEVGDLVESGEHTGQYKIPLNLNNTISNIYLSQPIRKIGNYSDSIDYEKGTVTRKIKKLVLTGNEQWGFISPTFWANLPESMMFSEILCTHYKSFRYSYSDPFSCTTNRGQGLSIWINDDRFNGNTNDFKTYLAQQYSNGTPVTVWYVLSTPEVEQITLPTITPSIESNTISVDTTLQPSNLSITYTSPDYSEIKLVYDNQGNILYNDPPYHDWGAVRWIVRQGLGPQYYPIGYIFYDNFNSSTGTAYQVVAHNHHFDPNLTALGYTYSMTCLEVNLNDYMAFDNIEAFLYTDTIIPAGTYRFTIPNYDATYGGNKTYYFTSTADLPAGSQIVMNWPYNQTPKTVTAYSPSGTTMVQTITTATTGWNGLTLTEYVDGTSPTATDLGTIAGPSTQLGTSNYGEMNHIHRARYGSNNYLQSGVRQYLNSNSAANTWWQPQTIFDRPYGGRTFAGKLTKLNQNLVDVLATPTIQSRTNSYFETTSLDGTTFSLSTNYDITTDKLFLLSPMEINFSTTDTTVGTVLDYYVGATNADRIKIRTSTGAAGYWWLRTPYPSVAYNVRLVYTSGALSNNYAHYSYGCAPAWVIQ